MQEIKLNQILYKLNTDYDVIEEVIVIWLYNIEKVKQDKEWYFFDAPDQLVAYTPMPDERYSDYYNDNINYFLETWFFKWPIEKHQFVDIYNVNSKVFTDKKDAEEKLKSYLIRKEAIKERNEKIDKLQRMIDELKDID